MNLYFLRHAKAGPHRKRWKPDSKRPLTEEGEKQTRKVAAGLAAMELEFDVILTSPYERALKTAQIASEVLKNEKLHTTEHLRSEGSAEMLIAHINEQYPTVQDILLVGHEPYMTSLMSLLLSGKSDLQIDFKKAGAAKLSADHGLKHGKCACLHWILTPRQVAKFAK